MSKYYNLYYLNYQKAFEISMLIDNNIVETIVKETSTDFSGEAGISASTADLKNIPVLGNYIPEFEASGNGNVSKSKKTLDNINVISTKSTMLKPVVERAKRIQVLSENKIGDLVKISNVELTIENSDDILSVKTLLSGLINSVPVDGVGDLDISKLFEVFLKDTAYIITGKNKGKFFSENSIAIKIPIETEAELENKYSISDLEIGKVTIIGIYRGEYSKKQLLDQMDLIEKMQNLSKNSNNEIETDEEPQKKDRENANKKIHFIDVIAIIQDLNL
ncbi:hypothetical protein I6N96_12795 [Enterococcus sp. BWM-S5]|uniref:Uncharacterized protein n=1 Tax=Enterococcus larvae TaxID=2794352 RepID=A0ABS4CMG3_9ENTE|nr:hypothetical protein [Enterococcus larvae]MBP1047152.1 hypothetical protein [Enterococcus larvae]